MKLGLAILAYLLMGLVLSAGILLLLAGKPWLLIISLAAFCGRVRKNRLHVALISLREKHD